MKENIEDIIRMKNEIEASHNLANSLNMFNQLLGVKDNTLTAKQKKIKKRKRKQQKASRKRNRKG